LITRMEKENSLSLLRRISLVILLLGFVSSLGLMFYAGRDNDSVVLMALFLGWVSAPYVFLLVANRKARRWSLSTRKTLYILMITIPLTSLVVYSGVLSPAGTKPAAVFLIVPLVSLILLPIVIGVSLARSRKSGV
jgi:hypothetical protein